MADSFGDEAPGASQIAAAAPPVHAAPLLDDPNDDFCRVCGFGVSSTQTSHPSIRCKPSHAHCMLLRQWYIALFSNCRHLYHLHANLSTL